MMDPHTAAELSLDNIIHIVDELIAAHRKWLPEYREDTSGLADALGVRASCTIQRERIKGNYLWNTERLEKPA
ncbi:hypothetical protein PilKf_01671 [Pillotina sp. SPG140]|jgi:hypothetical protein